MRALPPSLLLVAASVAGCAATAPPGFGPEPAQRAARESRPAQPQHEAPREPTLPRVPPGYAAAVTLPHAKSATVLRTRMDEGDAQVQNYEVQLEVVHADPQSADGDRLLATWMTGTPREGNLTRTRVAVARSLDGGGSFAPVALEIDLEDQSLPFDPSVGVDPATGRSFVAVMFQDERYQRTLWVAASDPQGDGFLPAVQADEGSLDKSWLAAGPARDGESLVYLSDMRGVRRSSDQGATWTAARRLPQQANLLQPLVLPDGTLAVSYFASTGQALFVRMASLDDEPQPVALHSFSGTYDELVNTAIPGGFRTPPTTMIAHDGRDGRLYAVLHDVTRRDGGQSELDILLKHSDDGGASWSAGRNLTADLAPWSDQFLPWLAVDAGGGLHLAYMETQRTQLGDAATQTDVHVWYAHSSDGGASWSRQRLTPRAIPSGLTRWSPLTQDVAQFVGDYFTVDTSHHAVYVAHPLYEDAVLGMAVSRIALAAGGSTVRDPRGLSGLWYEPATAGQGFQLEWIEGGRLTAIFYGHRDDGSNLFLTGVHEGPLSYGQTEEIALYATRGGRFNGFDASAISESPWGTLELRFDSCNQAHARLEGEDGTKLLALQRLTALPGFPCD